MDVDVVGPNGSTTAARFDPWSHGHMWGGTLEPSDPSPEWWPAIGEVVTIRVADDQSASAMVSAEGPKGPPELTVAGMEATPPFLA